jgi:hypothetical protein
VDRKELEPQVASDVSFTQENISHKPSSVDCAAAELASLRAKKMIHCDDLWVLGRKVARFCKTTWLAVGVTWLVMFLLLA